MIKNVYWSSCKVPFIVARFYWDLNFLDSFSINTPIPNFMKIRPLGAELFHVDGRTDRHMTKLIVAFRNFCERVKKNVIVFYKPRRSVFTGRYELYL